MAGNKAFLARAIAKAQRLSIEGTFCQALHEYIARETQVIWDDVRALLWVENPDGTLNVAVWLMPIASKIQQGTQHG